MKVFSAVVAILICSPVCHALPISIFQNTDTYIEHAKDIVIARCESVLNRDAPADDMLYAVEVTVTKVLKGKRKPGSLRVATVPLAPGKSYLLMSLGGLAFDTDFIAKDELAILPIPDNFDLQLLEGKSVKEQIQRIAARELYEVEQQLAPLLEKQSLLKRALQDRQDNQVATTSDIALGDVQEITTTAIESDRFFVLPSGKLHWSHAEPGKDGYLDFGNHLQKTQWEFTVPRIGTLADFDKKPLKATFLGKFEPGSNGYSVNPSVGQVVLARTADNPQTLYILEFIRQDAAAELATVRCATLRLDR
jgi:hypothetical protein